jgi:hypothetical protein
MLFLPRSSTVVLRILAFYLRLAHHLVTDFFFGWLVLAPKKTEIEKMRSNPKDDWTIDDVKRVVKQEGLEIRSPKRGGHYVVSSEHIRDSLCVPQNRPIKPLYIKELVGFVDAHRSLVERKKADDGA